MARSGLFLKYAIPLVLLSTGVLLVSSLVDGWFSYRENKAALARLQREKAAAAALRIEQFVRDLEHQLAWIAQTPWGARGIPIDQRRLDSLRLLRQVPAITELSHLDPKGREQLRVSRLAMDVLGSNQDFSGDARFREALARKVYFSPVYFRKESEPYMTIALAGSGEDSGVVAAEANLKFIWDVVSSMKVGKGGYAYVVDAQGRLIAHPDISLVLQKTDLAILPQVRAASAAARSAQDVPAEAAVGRDPQGREVLSAHAPMAPLGWLVFVDLPLAEAFAPIYSSMWRTVVLLLAGLAVAIAASLVLVRRMVSPIRALQTGAARIGAGALDQRITVQTGDELEALAEEFNSMAGRLRESYAGLEQKVEERTRDLREALEQQTATADILRVISSSPTDLQPVLDAIVESAVRLSNSSDAGILRVEEDRLRMVASRGELWTSDELLPIRRDVVTGRAVIDAEVISISDILAEPDTEFHAAKEYAIRFGYRSLLVVPMIREETVIGAINIRRKEMRPFTSKEIDLLKTFADQAVIAIENVRLFQALQQRTQELAHSVEQLRSLAEVSQAVNSSLDVQQVLETIVARAVQLSRSDSGAIYEHDEAKAELYLRATHGLQRDLADAVVAQTLPLGEGASGRAALTGAPVEIPDLHESGAYDSPLRPYLDQAGVRSILAIPLQQDRRVLGSLAVSRKAVGHFPPEVVELLRAFATQSSLAIQNARLFREIEQKGRELEVASRHKSQFLANMSHELRTPLNAILGYTELIVDQIYGEVPERILEVLERVQKSGRHLLGLINDVLDLSKIEAGQLELGIGEYSLETVVQATVSAVESLAAEKRLQLDVEIAANLPVGRGDERRLAQVLLNLMGNAIKFTEAGGVAVRASNSEGVFVVSVADTGPGIAETEREKIFEEFQQVDSSSTRAKGGTGLGLAIARRIVELHGGRIWVESTVGKGSTFFFSVPVQADRQGGPP
jgi:signal transduction histidine kinase/HAMP domain-containing protein